MNTFEVTINVAGRALTLELIEGDHISEAIRTASDFYERGMLDDIARRTRPGDLVLDIGAFLGNHTVFLAGVTDLRVIAIEPFPESADLLRKNVERNNLGHLVEVHQVAAGASRGKGGAVVPDPANLGMVRIDDSADGIEIVPIDELLGGSQVQVMKIDVEGMEPEVLEGATTTIADSRPLIYAEAADILAERQVRHWMDENDYRYAREFNQTTTQLFVPAENSVPALYPASLSMQAADQAYALAQMARLLRELTDVTRRQTLEMREYREQLSRTTSLFSELYKRVRATSGSMAETRAIVEQLLARLDETGQVGEEE